LKKEQCLFIKTYLEHEPEDKTLEEIMQKIENDDEKLKMLMKKVLSDYQVS
jgi:hypothetical protein